MIEYRTTRSREVDRRCRILLHYALVGLAYKGYAEAPRGEKRAAKRLHTRAIAKFGRAFLAGLAKPAKAARKARKVKP